MDQHDMNVEEQENGRKGHHILENNDTCLVSRTRAICTSLVARCAR